MYKDLYEVLLAKSSHWNNEEEVRYAWTAELSKALGIEFNLGRWSK